MTIIIKLEPESEFDKIKLYKEVMWPTFCRDSRIDLVPPSVLESSSSANKTKRVIIMLFKLLCYMFVLNDYKKLVLFKTCYESTQTVRNAYFLKSLV